MKRNVYESIFKTIFHFVGYSVFDVSFLYFLCSLFFDNEFNWHSLIASSIGIIIIFIGFVIRYLSRLSQKNSIIFVDGMIKYRGNVYQCSIKYFKFYISLFNETLVYPKLWISDGKFRISLYLIKKDVKELINKGYDIKTV